MHLVYDDAHMLSSVSQMQACLIAGEARLSCPQTDKLTSAFAGCGLVQQINAEAAERECTSVAQWAVQWTAVHAVWQFNLISICGFCESPRQSLPMLSL